MQKNSLKKIRKTRKINTAEIETIDATGVKTKVYEDSKIIARIETMQREAELNRIQANPTEIQAMSMDEKVESLKKILGNKLGSEAAQWLNDSTNNEQIFETLVKNAEIIGVERLSKLIEVLSAESVVSKYEEARKLSQLKNLDTYRTHGIIHVLDVLNSTIESYEAIKEIFEVNSELVNGINVEEIIYLSAILHDTGMSGGYVYGEDGTVKRIITESRTINKALEEVDLKGNTLRKSHSYNSAINTWMDIENLKAQGYSEAQIALASLLCYSHSKSNSGIKKLGTAENWGVAIERMCKAFEYIEANEGKTGIKSKFLETLKEVGIIKESSKGNIEVIESELLQRMGQMGLGLRLGDANTNNSNANTNQFGKEILTMLKEAKASQTEITEEYIASLIESGETEIIEKLAKHESSSTKYKIGTEIQESGQMYVQGEANQVYRTQTNNGVLEEVIKVLDADTLPYATIFAANERFGELNSGYDLDKPMRFVIELSNPSEYTLEAYKWYALQNTEVLEIEIRYTTETGEVKTLRKSTTKINTAEIETIDATGVKTKVYEDSKIIARIETMQREEDKWMKKKENFKWHKMIL